MKITVTKINKRRLWFLSMNLIMLFSWFISPWLLQDLRVFSSILLELLNDVDLIEKYLIFKYVEKCFVISSLSLGKTLLTTPSNNCIVGVITFSNLCRMRVEEFSSNCIQNVFEYHAYPLFIVVEGGQGCILLAKWCYFGTWFVVTSSCTWLD